MQGLRVALQAALILLCLGSATSASEERFVLRGSDLDGATTVWLPTAWRYQPRDDPSFARTDLDHRSWPEAPTDRLDPSWRGVGWFRFRFTVEPDLAGRPIGLQLAQLGASEVYLDGERVAAVGSVRSDVELADPRMHLRPVILAFETPGDHLLAVRYGQHRAERFRAIGQPPGFRIEIGWADRMLTRAVLTERRVASNLGLFTGIFLSFALLHALLFVFHREVRENFFFAVLCTICAAFVFLLLRRLQVDDPGAFLFSEPAMNVCGVAFAVVELRFVYGILWSRVPGWFAWIVVPASALLAVWGVFQPAAALVPIFLLMLAASGEMVRNAVLAIVRRRPGARVVGLGVAALALGFGAGLLAYLGVLPKSQLTTFTFPFAGMVVLVASMSVHLSHAFARTHRDLRAQLRRVEELSAARLAEERLRRAEEVERTALEGELARKAAELEEARQLQLSMLPDAVPQMSELEVAAFMETATEVGGDYYDFAQPPGGGLVVAIGDATGHGLRAGTMVIATKSLFQLLGADTDLPATLDRSATALRQMNLRRLSMALTLARFEAGKLRLAAAGMPPALVFRAASGEVDSLLVAGMPLGSRLPFRYQDTVTPFEAGDIALLMSDGFPERSNESGDLLGYERAASAFRRAAAQGGTARSVIDALVAVAVDWAGGAPADDDVTFVVVRAR